MLSLMLIIFIAPMLLQTVNCTIVNNFIKDYDSQDYAQIDCDSPFFDTLIYRNENVTAYVNICRPLTEDVFEEAEVPFNMKTPTCNIFIKRLVKKEYKYLFLDLIKNNGLDILNEGRSVKVFWDSELLDTDIFLEISPFAGLNNDTVLFNVDDTFSDGKTMREKRKLLKSKLYVRYHSNKNLVSTHGIITHSDWYWWIRVLLYIASATVFVFPRVKTLVNGIQWQDFVMVWLSVNLLFEAVFQFLGEKTPNLNALTILILPLAIAYFLTANYPQTKKLRKRELYQQLFYVALFANYLIFMVFFLKMTWANDMFRKGLAYCFLLPVLIRFVFLIMNDDAKFDFLWIPFLVSMFLFIRLLQLTESIKGMVNRSIKTPQMGEYSDRIFNLSWTIFLSLPYQIIALYLSQGFITNEDLLKKKINDAHDNETANTSTTKF